MVCRGGLTRDLMYGWRNLNAKGIFAGRIERIVGKMGVVWYGRNVSNRDETLCS